MFNILWKSSPVLPLDVLGQLCHTARVNLSAGLSPRDVFRQLSARGSRTLRPVAGRILEHLEKGDSFHAALQAEQASFPPLLLALVDVGEQTGHLPEVLEELERYYTQQLKFRRQLRSQTIGPVIQFALAVGIITLLIFVLGAIAESRGTPPPTVLGFRGATGALTFLLLVAIPLIAAFVGYRLLNHRIGRQAVVDGLVLRLPLIGPCVRALVMSRFALAMRLTLDTSMQLSDALRLSLQAGGNAAFAEQERDILDGVEDGEELAVALGRGPFMPAEFLTMVAVGEESGRLVETMRHQAAYYQDEAARRSKTAARVVTGLIWFSYVVLAAQAIIAIGSNILGGRGL
jgi:type IV pilus assembly protein PilC